ncbi:hypothetical protein ACFXG4_12170 [Nocardia sp. NPDC059246]|uniref:hypothetical protein n=1 Tax=unclassified Nocardia TaxID=2637762 RepID=UPI00369CFC6D
MDKPYRVIIWGPGEVGGHVLAEASKREDIEIVGVRVFSEAKEGLTVGELVGDGVYGVAATRSIEDIVSLEADCVILTPAASSIWGSLDDDVIALLESGKNVISTVAYHNVARENWTSGSRATAERLEQACTTGNASLLGTGIHPSFMAERLAVTMSQALLRVDHLRVVEALDFSSAPEGMWGGLDVIGFGTDPTGPSDDLLVSRIGDLYYSDLAANMGQQLFGADPAEIKIESHLERIPAVADVEAGGVLIRAGQTAVLHLVHRAFVGDHHYFTNEECWYVGTDNAFRANEPFGGWNQGMLCYTIEIEGRPTTLRSQIELEITEMFNPVTGASVRVILDALPAVCAAEPGILIDDVRTHVRLDPRVHHVG